MSTPNESGLNVRENAEERDRRIETTKEFSLLVKNHSELPPYYKAQKYYAPKVMTGHGTYMIAGCVTNLRSLLFSLFSTHPPSIDCPTSGNAGGRSMTRSSRSQC
jgi:hypothetical protein